jgi:hypothetical protein
MADILLIVLCYIALLSSILIKQRYKLYKIMIHLKFVKYCFSQMYTVP